MAQLNQGYAAAWKRVRKTRIKKTGMTEFFEAIDREYRGYRRDLFIARTSQARDAKAQEDTFRTTLGTFRTRFVALNHANERNWTKPELAFLRDFHTVLTTEAIAWNRPLISEAIASRAFDRSDEGEAHKLDLIVREARSPLLHLARTSTDVKGSAEQVRDKFKLALGASGYRQYLDTLKEATASLDAQIRTVVPLRTALERQIGVVGASASREATTFLADMASALRDALALASRAKTEHAGYAAALARFVQGWAVLERSVIAPRSKVKGLLDAAGTKLETLVKTRATLPFQRGVPADAAALARFKSLCTALPAARTAFDAADKAYNGLAEAVKTADDRNLGAMLEGTRSPFVVAAKKDLLAWSQSHAKARADLKALDEFAKTWRSLMGS